MRKGCVSVSVAPKKSPKKKGYKKKRGSTMMRIVYVLGRIRT